MSHLKRNPSRWISIAIILCLVCLLSGCAATQMIEVGSEPAGARILVKDVQLGLTPRKIKVDKKDETVILRLEKEGYEPAEIVLTRRFDGAYIPKAVVASSLVASLQLMQGGTTRGTVTSAGTGLAAGAAASLYYGFKQGGAYKFEPSNINTVLRKYEEVGYVVPELSDDEILVLDASLIQ
ncbi:PEGA domain-containing protein [bacterium]|nr:PEGA domain-containing protein [bacterium]